MKHVTCLLLSSLFVFSTGITTAAQDQKKRAEQDWVVELKTVLVELRAVVTDRQGNLVQGLKKEDFELREKGKLQDISSFAEERVGPLSISQRVAVANVAPGEPPPPAAEPARSLLLFVDTINMAGPNLLRVKQALKKFIDDQITDQDAVMVVTSGGMEGIPARFTRERNLLRYYVDKIMAWGSSVNNSYFTPALAADVRRESPYAMALAIQVLQSEEGLNPEMLSPAMLKQMALGRAGDVLAQTTFRRNGTLGTFRAAAELMSKAPGQRLMFLFSDGFSLLDNRGNVETIDLQQAISKAARSGTVVFSINSKGLQAPIEIDASRRGPAYRAFDPSLQGRLAVYASASEKDEQDGMNAIAKDTGGAAFFRTNDVNWALKKSFEGNNIYYAVAYYPTTEGQGFRDIVLQVKGHPEYTVRTQKGYLASDVLKNAKATARSPQQRLFDAIARPIPETALNVSASVQYLEVGSDNAKVSIRLLIDGSRLTYHEQGDRANLAIEVAGTIYDRAGKLVTSFIEKIKGGVPIAQLSTVKNSGFSYTKRLELKPGSYQVRVGALEPETENIGTGNAWVEVPDLAKGKLELSSVLLGTAAEAQQSLSGPQQLDAIKSYKAGSTMVYYLMLYNAPSTIPSDLTIRSEIVRNDKVIYESEPQPVSSRMLGKDDKGIEIGGQLNLDLDPGFYVLRLEIKDKSNHEFRRSVEFFVQH